MKSKSKTYSVKVSDTITTKDGLVTFKRWFNGTKKFFTVKVDPAKRK